jgi:intergrase/recombinase
VNPVFSVNEQLFFQRDLRKIHSIINSATSNRGDTYIETLNTKLAEQLEKLVSTNLMLWFEITLNSEFMLTSIQ